MVKRLPTVWEIWVRSLGEENPLEKEMATHSSTLAWKIPWTEEPGSAETPVLWPPHEKNGLIGKGSDAGRDWGQEEKGMTEDEIAGWYQRLDGHVFVNSGRW